ncbi:VOC family protein [Microbacterium sp. RD1]|uniref:VOC family protein n=1 Tax=Microbacterium sp. RD1 TaxID=3457313 RepID=UPI003FA55BCB
MSGTVGVNHIGVTVPDIRGAVRWYSDVLGLRCIMGPRVLRPAASGTSETRSILGPGFALAYQAHLLGPDGVGLELFQFVDPPTRERHEGLGWEERGPWHVCFTVPDVEEALQRIEGAGGERVSDAVAFVPGRPWLLAYARDPWGTVLELMNAPYADVFSAWPQPGATEDTEWLEGGRMDGGQDRADPA